MEDKLASILIEKKLITPDLAVSKRLREAILSLSAAFTRGRHDLPSNYFEIEINSMAYLAGFVLTNATKTVACLKQVRHLLPSEGAISVLDIGSGPGTAVFAASSLLLDRSVNFTGVEKTPGILKEAKRLEGILPDNHSVEWIAGNINNIRDRKFDVAIAANVINELEIGKQFKTCKEILSRSKILIIIDPALKQTSRQLMALRDEFLNESSARVAAPCTHQAPCPMLADNERDWCHFYIEWKRPKLVEAIDRATGLDHRYLKMSYLILGEVDRNLYPSQPPLTKGRSLFRVVSSPLHSKGKLELVVCGNGELKRVRRLDKNASETNSQFGSAVRGDLVRFSEKERPGEIRAHDSFDIVLPFTQPSIPSETP